MGSDWEGNENFECLRDLCEVTYPHAPPASQPQKSKKDLGLAEPKGNLERALNKIAA